MTTHKSGAHARPKDPSPKRQSKGSSVLKPVLALIGVAAFVVTTALGVSFYRFVNSPVLEDPDKVVTLAIPPGTPWGKIVDIMAREGIVKSPKFFSFWARSRKLDRAIKAGVYELKGPMDLERLEQTLRSGGKGDGVQILIPEGFTIYHMADRLEKMQITSKSAFLKAATDEALLKELGIPGESVEGYIFPDTYRFKKNSNPYDIIRRMHLRFEKVWAKIKAEYPGALASLKQQYDLDPHDVITTASLIERETNYNPERQTIAQVFYNRIKRGMKLQTDPSCVYGPNTYRKIPRPSDCKNPKNKYSTYVNKGLPPGPISLPGEQSLVAALDPDVSARGKELLFFVAKRGGKGAHYFSKTYQEHKEAIRKFLLPPEKR